MASDRLSLRLPERLRIGLETLVESTVLHNESNLAREAIEEYLFRHSRLPNCFDIAAEQSGLIPGCVDTKMGDLEYQLQNTWLTSGR